MKKKMILMLTSLLFLSGCGDNTSSDSLSNSVTMPNSNEGLSTNLENNLPLEAKVFIESLEAWINEELTLEHKSLIDSAYFIYDSLSEDSKNLPQVKEAKEKLDQAKEAFLEIYQEYLTQKEIETTGYAFVDAVNKIKDVEFLLKTDKDLIVQLNLMYDSLPSGAKTLSVVISSKEKLDSFNLKMNQLEAMNESEYAAYEFSTKVSLLPTKEELTIGQIDLITEMVEIYNELPDDIKEKSEVKLAKEKLDTLTQRVEELKVIRNHAESFIDDVYRLPTFDKLKWKDAGQDSQIKACEDKYLTLTEEEKAYPGVSNAYRELQSTREAFDNLKEPFDISKFGFSISLGAFNNSTNNYNLQVVFSSGTDPLSVLTNYYNLPKENIRDYAIVYLNMYYEAGAIKSDPLYRFDITESYNLTINDFVNKLRELKNQGNEKAVSGKGYNFTINIESKCDLYASSEYSNFSVGAVINF